jgi:hypothetical protein
MNPEAVASYSTNLDRLLALPQKTGQGGQVEADFDTIYRFHSVQRGALYSFLASEVQKTIGPEDADKLLRNAVLTWGRYRGERIRLRLERAGLPCDIEHLQKWWDHPSPAAASEKEFTSMGSGAMSVVTVMPHWSGYDSRSCAIHDGMVAVCPEVEKLKFAYCEEVHRGVSREVNPEIEVWYPALLTRGQGKCIWRFTMPKESVRMSMELAQEYREKAKKDGKAGELFEFGSRAPYRANATPTICYEFEADRLIQLYHFVTDAIIRRIGFDTANAIAKVSLHRWGKWRGRKMREDHKRRGWKVDVRNFITYHDDPSAGDAWIAENIRLTPQEHHRIVTKSFYANRFDEYGTGRLATLFYEESFAAQTSAYEPLMKVQIPQLMERGDRVSEFRFEFKGA